MFLNHLSKGCLVEFPDLFFPGVWKLIPFSLQIKLAKAFAEDVRRGSTLFVLVTVKSNRHNLYRYLGEAPK